ncbi:MAG: hypothetical protein AAF280_14125 [Pseudomonadota bacterium]
MPIVPTTYEEWEHCITVQCGIPLTAEFADKRIIEMQDENDFHTQKFIDQWGEAHHAQTLAWFEQAKARLTG